MILLEELHTEFGTIKITRSPEDGTHTYYQDGCFHSQADANGVSTCAYVHVMYQITRAAKAQRILLIGCAGGTLATMLSRDGCDVTVVDINAQAFVLAKRYFHMPDSIECVVAEGHAYLEHVQGQYDAILIDAFSSDYSVPQGLTSEAFFRLVRRALPPEGLVVMNIVVAHDLDRLADTVAIHMEAARVPTILFDRPGIKDRNIILAGGKVPDFRLASQDNPPRVRQQLRRITRRSPIRPLVLKDL